MPVKMLFYYRSIKILLRNFYCGGYFKWESTAHKLKILSFTVKLSWFSNKRGGRIFGNCLAST